MESPLSRRLVARTMRLTRERAARHDDLVKLATGMLLYTAITGKPPIIEPECERPARRIIRSFDVNTIL